MRALVNFDSAPGSVQIREVSEPVPGPTDVIVEVQAVGVCGSDVHQSQGKASWVVEPPVILGHEFGGVVVAVGAAVPDTWLGVRVVSETAAHLPADSPYLRVGKYHIDPDRRGFGARVDGAMAHLVRTPARCLHKVPDALPMTMAALAEPLCVAFNATLVRGRVAVGDNVTVIGPGPVGLLSAWLAAQAGAAAITLVGTPHDHDRLALGAALGATGVARTPAEAIGQTRSHFDGYGAHLVIDAAGVSAALELALDVVRPGGAISKVGWGPQPLGFSLDPLVAKSVDLRGSFSHSWDTWERALKLLEAHWRTLVVLTGWRGHLEDWAAGFEAARSGAVVKPVLHPNGNPDPSRHELPALFTTGSPR